MMMMTTTTMQTTTTIGDPMFGYSVPAPSGDVEMERLTDEVLTFDANFGEDSVDLLSVRPNFSSARS